MAFKDADSVTLMIAFGQRVPSWYEILRPGETRCGCDTGLISKSGLEKRQVFALFRVNVLAKLYHSLLQEVFIVHYVRLKVLQVRELFFNRLI